MMKRVLKTALMLVFCAFLLAGCGVSLVQDEEGDDISIKVEADEGQDESSEGKAADTGLKYEDPKSLPEYKYTGDDPYEEAMISYLMESEFYRPLYQDQTDVLIPVVLIAEKDESDPDDILVFGGYGIQGYRLRNTTLYSVTGSWGSGIFHLRKSDGRLTVESTELPMVYEEITEVFEPYEGMYDKVEKIMEDDQDNAFDTAIADYAKENDLFITATQNSGRTPRPLPGMEETPEEAEIYTYSSPIGYSMTFDMRKITLNEDSESDMYGDVSDDIFTGTLMTVEKSESSDENKAIEEAAKYSEGAEPEIETATIGKDLGCQRGAWDEELEDGRIFRYICYAVPYGDDVYALTLQTTYEEGVSEMSREDLDEFFADQLSSFEIISDKAEASDDLFASHHEISDPADWILELPQAEDEDNDQLFIVAGMGMDKTTATVFMVERNEEGKWKQILSTPAYVGKNGLCDDADHEEGCGQTPIGCYKFNKAFGIADDPGCDIPYVKVDEDTYWSGDPNEGMHYNEMVDIKDYPDLEMDDSEHIVDYEYQYRYCLNISFNEDGTPGRGSAIFLHCLGPEKPYTGGCVAVPENIMKIIMQEVDPDCVVVIDTMDELNKEG